MKKRILSAAERSEILALLSAGYSRTTAVKYIRSTPDTLRRAIAEDADFAEQVARAEEGSEVFYLSCIRRAALKEQYWRAAAWVLERRLPERYGNKKPETPTAEQLQQFLENCIQIIAEELPDGEKRTQILNRLSEGLE